MSSNGRRRSLKIVGSIPQQKSRAKEITGGIKNALDKGEPLAKAKQSFINAGYTPQEVEEATKMIESVASKVAKPLPSDSQDSSKKKSSKKKSSQKKHKSKTLILILSIIGAIILISATALVVFWDKIFA